MKFEIEDGHLISLDDEDEDVKEITIPDGVTHIDEEVFAEWDNLETVIMPDSVVYIGTSAFSGCVDLKNIRFSKNLRFIGNNALGDTKWIFEQKDDFVIINDAILYMYRGNNTDVVIPECVKYISPVAFFGNINIESITMSDNVLEIGFAAFDHCVKLRKIRLSENLKIIQKDLFCDCFSLSEITLPDSVTQIGWHAFYKCIELEKIKFPEKITDINSTAFDETKWLCERDFVLIDKVLYKYTGKQADVVIPDNVEVIGEFAFYRNEYIENVVMSDNVRKICKHAFDNCINLKSIRLSENIPYIEQSSFSFCSSLESIEIPESVKEIKAVAFRGCVRLNEVKIHGKLTAYEGSFKETALEYDWIIPQEYDEFNLAYSDENKEYCFAFRSADKSEEYRLNAVKPGHLDGYEVFRDITTGRYGYKNKLGEVLIKPEFFIAYPFNGDGFAVVMTEDKDFGVINVQGEFVIPAESAFIRPEFPERIAAIRRFYGWLFIDMNNNYVVSSGFDEVSDCISGYAAVKKDGKWGLIRVNSEKKFTFV